ncbi:hypothetical protein P167DRAFT_308349 [Morchella conica CCBAS932]|uniref:Uncharacterized protein n=1 Tax=Morchella conica CCBAS932 TaxID=1392247 RepID=A0A3N4KFJ2_9PEZI|nr:hypothetical protein P167DRAFT_308349 [Morchella conica CCBAS932]
MLEENREASGNTGPKQQWASGDNDHLWNHVNKFDDRVDNLTKTLGDFKGDVNKSIGELVKAVEKGFGEMRVDITKLETKIVTEIAGLKSDSKVTKWQINLLFGGATAVSTILFSNIRYS